MITMSKIPIYHEMIATGLGSGYSPIAPGTAGAALAVLVWWGYSSLLSPVATVEFTALLTVIFTVLGTWSSAVAETFWGEDPKRVVIDEVVGTWIALLAVPGGSHWGYPIAAFVLFRFFDIAKPLGIRRMERLPGGYGIMADDILSGIYAFLLIILFRYCCA